MGDIYNGIYLAQKDTMKWERESSIMRTIKSSKIVMLIVLSTGKLLSESGKKEKQREEFIGADDRA